MFFQLTKKRSIYMLLKNSFSRTFFLYLIALFSMRAGAFAQTMNAFAFPSPNNTFLGSAGTALSGAAVGVDLYTGTAQVNVALCNLASKELTIPMSIDYIGSRGIPVQDYAGSVGLGWQLNAGGSVSRVVRGFPDEGANGYLGTGQWGKLVANNLANGATLTQAQYTAITGINSNGSYTIPTADGEPDLYFVKTPFFSFQFTFDENGNPVVSNANGMQVLTTGFFNNNSNPTSSFEVIDDSGNEYFFGSSYLSQETSTTKLYGTNYTFPTTWYLDKIVTYNSKDVITLTYTSYFTSEAFSHYQTNTTYDASGHSNTDNTPIVTTVNQPLVVTKISSSLGEVDFLYATSGRRDDTHAVSLSSMSLEAFNPLNPLNPTLLQTYSFNYSYFGDPSSDPNVLRLRLDNIGIAGNTTATYTPVTLKTFTYNSQALPSRQLLSQVDFWGYYTAPLSNPYTTPLPPSQSYAMADVLTNISDLAGSSYQLSYELNAYYNTSSSSNVQVGGLRVNQITKTVIATGEALTTQYSYVDVNGHSTGQILDNSYLIVGWIVPPCTPNSWAIDKSLSETPSNIYDLNGNFIGYSSVKTTQPNGGYSISSFSNFLSTGAADQLNYVPPSATVPDVTSSISMAYKRGLLLDYAVYAASGNIISEDATPYNNYVSLTSPVVKKGWGYHWGNLSFSVSGSGYLNSCNFAASSTYRTIVENFRPATTTHTDYDQNNPANFVRTATSYTYAANKRLVQTVTTSDSKGQTLIKTIYHPDDLGTPLVTTPEQAALTAMVGANRINVPVHQLSSRNGAMTEIHYSYGTGTLNLNNSFLSTYLNSVTNFKTVGTTRTQVRQKLFNYDVVTSNLISTNEYSGLSNSNLVGKPVSVLYGYNSSYPVARIENANSTSSYQQGSGSLNGYFSQTATIPASISGTGTMSFGVYATGFFNSATITVYYTLTGPSYRSGNASISAAGTVMTVNLTGLLPGSYTLAFTTSSSNGTYYPTFYYSGSYAQLTTSYSSEYFYEGFEQSYLVGSTTVGGAHSGNGYYNGSSGAYTIPFTLPDSRNYTLQYFSLVGGNWVFTEQPYTTPISLSGAIDDVRIFPSDALMTSYTYNPQTGMTSQTDPSGKTQTSQYDGLNRLLTLRDQDNNILKQYDYEYQLLVAPVFNSQQSGAFTKTNCPSGYTGKSVTYIVPANTYSSYISTADANAKAMADVNANGLSYANAQSTASMHRAFCRDQWAQFRLRRYSDRQWDDHRDGGTNGHRHYGRRGSGRL